MHAIWLRAVLATAALGFDPINNTPEEFTAYIKVEVTKWAKVIKVSGARVD